jgi:hypothetical protein
MESISAIAGDRHRGRLKRRVCAERGRDITTQRSPDSVCAGAPESVAERRRAASAALAETLMTMWLSGCAAVRDGHCVGEEANRPAGPTLHLLGGQHRACMRSPRRDDELLGAPETQHR